MSYYDYVETQVVHHAHQIVVTGMRAMFKAIQGMLKVTHMIGKLYV